MVLWEVGVTHTSYLAIKTSTFFIDSSRNRLHPYHLQPTLVLVLLRLFLSFFPSAFLLVFYPEITVSFLRSIFTGRAAAADAGDTSRTAPATPPRLAQTTQAAVSSPPMIMSKKPWKRKRKRKSKESMHHLGNANAQIPTSTENDNPRKAPR
ncbi:hypothetical protein FN846DRAFT_1009741 [Sphaerosporella brunnea]|uniref:Uncharacterized protein n=1 Tax=Sphaerosporella brunnea TaxID=1250544 RepID=A0A5J5ED97_9PEZI|nr:hypothetical protein FN846DRAFT_1009741 [Sphaerosporella brunnea]